MGYFDRALKHRRTYLELARKAGPLGAGSVEELDLLAKDVAERENVYASGAPQLPPLDRALLAKKKGLAGKARDVLLESHVSAFGPKGMQLELGLLLRTGRARNVWEWTTPEHKSDLGAPSDHLLQA